MNEMKRFVRTEALLGKEKMENLYKSTVMIIGLGAVGGYVLEGMARAGIGHLILVDFDSFDETNINRQILALTSTLGRKKTEVAKERVAEINPDCYVEIKDMFVSSENLKDLFEPEIDIVIDAIDTVSSKCDLMEYMCRNDINFISSMGAALKADTTKIIYGKLSETKNCTLSKKVRKILKQRSVDIAKINCVSSTELPQKNNLADTEKDTKKMMGSLPTITAIFGLTIANEAIKILIEKA